MSYLNHVVLIGNLGKNPEVLNKTDKGKFVKLELATNKKYRNAENKVVKDVQWHTICLNGGVAQFAVDYLQKGNKVLIIGELRTNEWTDKEGIKRRSTSIFGKSCKSFPSMSSSRDAAETEAANEDYATEAV